MDLNIVPVNVARFAGKREDTFIQLNKLIPVIGNELCFFDPSVIKDANDPFMH